LSFTNYLEAALVDHFLKTSAYTQATNLYVGLSTADPTDDASGLAEPSGNGYARVNHDSWNAFASGAATNNGVITFPAATGSWGTVTHFFIADHLTAGNMLASGALDSSQAIGDGNTPSFADDAISVELD